MTVDFYRSHTKCRRFGVEFWFHSRRIGLDFNFWDWSLIIMQERP